VDLTVKKITNKHDELGKDYKAVKREYCDTTGGGKNEGDATLDSHSIHTARLRVLLDLEKL
jgi:hypothetical protein